jgi:hypothetical protein
LSYREKRHPTHLGYARPTRRVRSFQAHRSLNAQRIDEGLKAPRARTTEQWLAHPNRFDIPDVDTPKKQEQQQDKPFEPRPKLGHAVLYKLIRQ